MVRARPQSKSATFNFRSSKGEAPGQLLEQTDSLAVCDQTPEQSDRARRGKAALRRGNFQKRTERWGVRVGGRREGAKM